MVARNLRVLRHPLFFSFFLIIFLSGCSFGKKESKAPPPPTSAEIVAEKNTEAVLRVPTPMDTFRALAPPQGLKFTPLFDVPLDDADARMERLENSVQFLRNDFDTTVPSMVRLVAIEKDIKNLVSQLETLTAQPIEQEEIPPLTKEEKEIPGGDVAGGVEAVPGANPEADTSAPTSLVTPEAAPKGKLPPEGAASPSSPALLSIGDVKAVRIGDHMDKTRIVLDMTAKPNVSANISGGGKQLIVDVPQMNWLAQRSWDANTANLVSAYRFENGKFYADMLYTATIKSYQILPPSEVSPNYRLVIDLYSADVHQ